MAPHNSITIVASPRPRVGKTLLARLLTDFHRHDGGTAKAFDLNTGEGTLAQFLPEVAVPATIGDIRGQMALFDALVADDGAAKIVDLGHQAFEPFFALAEQIGLVDEARRREVAPTVLFVLTPDRTAAEAYRVCRRQFPDTVAVHNEMFGPVRQGVAAARLRLPMLAPALRKYVEGPPFSFERMADATAIPLDAHIELQRWLRRAYQEFRALDGERAPEDPRSAAPIGS